jgi:hypothetical protein
VLGASHGLYCTIPSPPKNNFKWVLGNSTLKHGQDPRIRKYQVLSRITIGLRPLGLASAGVVISKTHLKLFLGGIVHSYFACVRTVLHLASCSRCTTHDYEAPVVNKMDMEGMQAKTRARQIGHTLVVRRSIGSLKTPLRHAEEKEILQRLCCAMQKIKDEKSIN